jgi:hypothetical protein
MAALSILNDFKEVNIRDMEELDKNLKPAIEHLGGWVNRKF